MNAIKSIATSLISFWLVFLLTIPAAARDNSCRVTPHMERLSEITTPQQSFSGVLSKANADGLIHPTEPRLGYFKNIPFRVPAQSEVEITVIGTQSLWDGRPTWLPEIRGADGKLVGFTESQVVWHYSTATLMGEDSNGKNIIRWELRGRLPFQTTRDLDVILLLRTEGDPVTYDIRTQVKRYGDHQFNIDAGTEPEKALPIVPGTTIRGHFPSPEQYTVFRLGWDSMVFINEGRLPAPSPVEPVEVSPYYTDRLDLYVLKDVPLGTTLNARILDTKLRKPPGYVYGGGWRVSFIDYVDQLSIKILQIACEEDGPYLFSTPNAPTDNNEETSEEVRVKGWFVDFDDIKGTDTFIATYSGDYYIALTRPTFLIRDEGKHPMEYAFIVETDASQLDWPDYPYLVAENPQFVRGIELFEPDPRPEKGHYWSPILPDDMVENYGLDHIFLLVYGPDILRSSGAILQKNPKLSYRSVYRGNFSDDEFLNRFGRLIDDMHRGWSRKGNSKRQVQDIIDDEIILISVEMKKGTQAGLHSFRLDSPRQDKLPALQWILRNSNNPANIRFVRSPRQDDFDDISEVFIYDRIFLKLKADFPVDADEISVDISISGQQAKIIGQDDAIIKLHRVPGSSDRFTSKMLGLISANSQASSNSQDITYIQVEAGKLLTAHIHPYAPVSARNFASAKIYVTPANIDALWLKAMVDAAKATKIDLKQHDITTNRGLFKLSDQDFTVPSPHRNIPIKLGDIAAMLLLKHNFINAMELIYQNTIKIRELSKTDDLVLHGFRETFREIAKNPGSAFGSIPVPALSGQGFIEGISEKITIGFYHVYDERYLQDRFGGIAWFQIAWQDKATASVLDTYIEAIKAALDEAKGLKSNDWLGLLELTAVHFRPIQDRILPNLLRLKEDRAHQTLYWEPDKVARGYLLKVAELGRQLQANREVREASRNVILAVTVLTVAAPEILVFRILSMTVNAAVLLDAVTFNVIDYLDRKKEAEVAFGALEVLGFRRLEYARQREISAAMLGVNIIGSLAGVAGEGLKLYQFAKLKMTLADVPEMIKILDQFSEIEKLSEAQKESLALIVGEVSFLDYKLKQSVGQFFLTPVQQQARRAVHKIMPRLSRFDEIKFRAQLRGFQMLPSSAAKTYEFPKGRSIDGLLLDKPLGKGVGAEVYSLFDYDDEAFKLITGADANDVITRTMRTVKWLEDAEIPYLKIKRAVRQSQSGDGIAYLIQERLPKGAHVYGYGTKDFPYTNFEGKPSTKTVQFGVLEYGGFPLPKNKQRALMELFKKLAKSGLVCEDCHLKNIYFQRVGDKWQAGLLDFDRIVPMSEDFTQLLSKGETNAFRAMQNSPGWNNTLYKNAIWSMKEGILPPNADEALEMGMHVYPNPDFFMEKVLEYKWFIRYDRKNRVWLDSVLEMDVVEEYFPDIRKHVDMTIHEIN